MTINVSDVAETPPPEVDIMGLGGVGFWLAVALSRSGIKYRGYDMDDLQGGLGKFRLPTAPDTTKKIELLRGFLLVNMGVGIRDLPELHARRYTGTEVREGSLLVDCSDMTLRNPDRRVDPIDRTRVWERAKDRGARILRVSYDGRNNTVVVSEGLPMSLNPAVGGYAQVPSMGLSFMAGGIGAEAVKKIVLEGHKDFVEFQISLDDYFKPIA